MANEIDLFPSNLYIPVVRRNVYKYTVLKVMKKEPSLGMLGGLGN